MDTCVLVYISIATYELHLNICVFIKLCRCESKRYLLLSCEFDNPKEWGGIDLLYLDCCG